MTALERAINVFSPEHARKMAGNRMATTATVQYLSGQYTGASRSKTSLKNFTPAGGSADSDTIGDLPTLRARTRDLARNAGIARGARNTSKVNVVGTGLKLKSEIHRELLGMSEEAADAWEANTEKLFHLWADSKFADSTRAQNFYELQGLAFLSSFDNGETFALRRYKESASFLALCIQLIEADRVSTPNDKTSDPNIVDGIEVSDGEEVALHVRNKHPGDDLFVIRPEITAWERIPARTDAGALMLHLFDRDRIGLTRGVPLLAPVIDDLKQLDRYSDAELMAAVVSAFFTVFIKHTEGGSDIVGEDAPELSQNQIALGSGTIADLAPGEEPVFANPARPNANFDPFFLAIVRKIGIAIGIPYEVLIMHFSSSYSASKAALEVAWQFFMDRRTWLARNFCQPVYEWFLYEAVARGLIVAPGFLDDPIRRAAWLGSVWIGPAQISIDPVKEVKADIEAINAGLTTLEAVTMKRDGGNWKNNQVQRGRECAVREENKIKPAVPEPPPQPAAPGASGGSNAGS